MVVRIATTPTDSRFQMNSATEQPRITRLSVEELTAITSNASSRTGRAPFPDPRARPVGPGLGQATLVSPLASGPPGTGLTRMAPSSHAGPASGRRMNARSFALIANPHAGRGAAVRVMAETAAALRDA